MFHSFLCLNIKSRNFFSTGSKQWTPVHHQYVTTPSARLTWPNICKDGGCQFNVVASNRKGMGYASEPSQWIGKYSTLL